MSEIDPVVVAKGLSEAQRKVLLETSDGQIRRYREVAGQVRAPLFRKELLIYAGQPYDGGGWLFRLTPLGLAVKSIIEKSHV